MKIFITLLVVLNISVVQAGEDIFFTKIPANITISQAVDAVQNAAERRKWTASRLENNKLQAKLNHHDYEAVLIFSFTADEIRYTDLTIFYEMDDDEQENGEKTPAPARWVRNLKKDTNYYFRQYPVRNISQEKMSPEDLENKLAGLKKMYNKQLITEVEYNQKKKEIMSRY